MTGGMRALMLVALVAFSTLSVTCRLSIFECPGASGTAAARAGIVSLQGVVA